MELVDGVVQAARASVVIEACPSDRDVLGVGHARSGLSSSCLTFIEQTGARAAKAAHVAVSAVIDFGGLGVGDPACDLIVAWSLLRGGSRAAFRAALAVDDATWERGRGWALSIGLIAAPYYEHTRPEFASIALRMVGEALTEVT